MLLGLLVPPIRPKSIECALVDASDVPSEPEDEPVAFTVLLFSDALDVEALPPLAPLAPLWSIPAGISAVRLSVIRTFCAVMAISLA